MFFLKLMYINIVRMGEARNLIPALILLVWISS